MILCDMVEIKLFFDLRVKYRSKVYVFRMLQFGGSDIGASVTLYLCKDVLIPAQLT